MKKKNKPVSLLLLHASVPTTDCLPVSDFSHLPASIMCSFVIAQWQEKQQCWFGSAHQFLFQVIYLCFQKIYGLFRWDIACVLYFKEERPSRTQHPNLKRYILQNLLINSNCSTKKQISITSISSLPAAWNL